MSAGQSKVVMAMSGGVDSSVAAALLKRDGFEVVGVFMKFWSEAKAQEGICSYNRCCSPEAETRARNVALSLGIPFYVFNFEKEFKKRIVDYFLAEYRKGNTPNPCVVCNKEIKFGLLLEKSFELGADYVATGHYASKRELKDENEKAKMYKVLTARDTKKDQSYFLWQLNQNQLKSILFPLGNYVKPKVVKLARQFNLPLAGVPESMEVCFVPTTVNDFLSRYLKKNPGKIVDKKGKVLGQHQGLWFYTIGQRKGLGLAGNKPFYVLGKDVKNNVLIAGQNKKDLSQKEIAVKMVNWILGKEPKLPLQAMVKIRYRRSLAPAKIYRAQGKESGHRQAKQYKIIFKSPQTAVTSGQSAVFYLPNSRKVAVGKRQKKSLVKTYELLGGGVIC